MGEILRIYGPGDIRFDTYEERPLQADEVRIKTLYSGISAGTELTHFRGTNPYRNKKWDDKKRIFTGSNDSSYYPRGTGYEEVGEVCETGAGVRSIKKGDIVYGAWQHKSTHIMNENEAAANKLPPELAPLQGIFAQIGSIALNGILDSQINLGETVAVFGQGTPGLICTRLAKLSGAKVIAVDLYAKRLELAANMGADYLVNAREIDAGEKIKEITNGLGADVCLEVSGSGRALASAIKACAYSARVVAIGFYQNEVAGLYLAEEFHHNRINIVCSQIGGISQNLLYRWSMQRLRGTIMELQKEKQLELLHLVTHQARFRDALDIYRLIDKNPQEVLQAVLCF